MNNKVLIRYAAYEMYKLDTLRTISTSMKIEHCQDFVLASYDTTDEDFSAMPDSITERRHAQLCYEEYLLDSYWDGYQCPILRYDDFIKTLYFDTKYMTSLLGTNEKLLEWYDKDVKASLKFNLKEAIDDYILSAFGIKADDVMMHLNKGSIYTEKNINDVVDTALKMAIEQKKNEEEANSKEE